MTYSTHPSFGKPMGATDEGVAGAINESIARGGAIVEIDGDRWSGAAETLAEECDAEKDGVFSGVNIDGQRWAVRVV